MNKQEILEEIAELKDRLNKLEKMYDSLELPNKRWRGENGDVYYFIGAGGKVCLDRDNEVTEDGMRYALGNYFKTKGEAEFEAERLKVIAELKEWATPISEFTWSDDTRKYALVVVNMGESSCLEVGFYYTNQVSDLYFESKEVAKRAIESIGEERIIKYYFRRGEINGDSD